MLTQNTQNEQLIVATANTHFGRMITTPEGLDPVARADVLLLQEIFNPAEIKLETQLKKAGFKLLHSAPRFGLAIALRAASLLAHVPNSEKEYTLAKMGAIEKMTVKKHSGKHSLPFERGFISDVLKTPQGRYITIAATHPTTPVTLQPRARYRQIITMEQLLALYYRGDCLILGGDMNHYPKPRKIDKKLHLSAQLTPVQLGNEPTWRVRGSKQESLFALPSFLLNQPTDHFDGQHDIILYRKDSLDNTLTDVVDIPSDHRAIIAQFTIK